MKYCTHCGAEINEHAVVCVKCGCSVKQTNVINENDSSSFGYAILGFFIPIAGLILWLIWKDEYPRRAKSAGIGALVSVIVNIVFIVLYFIFIIFILGLAATSYSGHAMSFFI